MTILAGIVSRYEGEELTDSVCESIKRCITRYPDDEVIEFRDARAYLAKVDIGAYGHPALKIGKTSSVLLLAGEPLLRNDAVRNSNNRLQEVHRLLVQWDMGNWAIGESTRGVFCAVHYEPAKGRLTLISDKLGVRPLYYWMGEKYIVFSSALRILEDLPEVPKQMDLRGVTEIANFGFPLGCRTPYSNIFTLKAAEVIEFQGKAVVPHQYWRWDRLRPKSVPSAELLAQAYALFTEAVALRLRGDKTTVAFLSGGLDSRCIIGVLDSISVKTHTFNFAPLRWQDQVFGAEFARKVGAIHQEVPMDLGTERHWTKMLANAWGTSKYRTSYRAERPRLAWSGEGGSVGVGTVYLTRQIVDLMRSEKRDEAIAQFLRNQQVHVPHKLFQPAIADAIAEMPRRGIQEELDDIYCEDPGRGFHLFLMLNDQRRHLYKHFEDIDLHRMELQLPFYDGDFLELILSSPIDLFLEHDFYNAWLAHFPTVVTSVPWQTYPGHAKCPLPIPDNLTYQYAPSKLPNRTHRHQAISLLRSEGFPHHIIRRVWLGLATFLTLLGIRDYGYILKTALHYSNYWKRCEGNIEYARQAEA